MRFLFNFANFFGFFLATTIVVNSPLMLMGFVLRRRVDRRVIRGALALGFAAWEAYLLWLVEWTDVWRHGIPPASYIIKLYVPYMAALGLLGWFVGGLIARPRGRRLATRDSQASDGLATSG
jgi:hypothetical protein